MKDAILFVHGVGSTGAIWNPQICSLSNDYRAIAIELRGNGAASDPPPETITREGFVDDVLAAADAETIQRFHFVGCSLGGVVGFELYKRAPERVRSLTFVGSFAAYPDANAYVSSIRQAVLAAGSMPAFAGERAAKLGLPAHRMAETIDQMACKSVESYLASTQATWTGDYRSMLPTIAVPTL
ncbi:MAG: alpha/beta hydrolase, partial [Candidatus Eremiobacteraeota bacterium]|nr:alpha/beta hydrolase [Candidatus Eremiobacteraeota bacterium]